MKFLIILIVLINLFSPEVSAQTDQSGKKAIGISAQVYPAGIIATINLLKPFNKWDHLSIRAGGNFADRKDFSPYNDYEEGSGFGAAIGYRRNFYVKRGFLFLAANLDVWNMWIHWQNDVGEVNYSNGTSYTLVIQPWVEFGYFIDIKRSPLQLGLSTGFGREINVITKGKEVGQGWMNSLLLTLQYSFE